LIDGVSKAYIGELFVVDDDTSAMVEMEYNTFV
jgi:hypothetical protein